MKPLAALAFAAAVIFAGPAGATQVFAANSGTTDLGYFDAGTYKITATGLVSLVGFGLGNGFDMRPDGVPDSEVTAPGYGYFNPAGTDLADGIFGAGGAGIKIGALMGSFIPVAPLGNNPAPLSTYFFIGFSKQVVHTGGNIYAQVNDTFYSNDGGYFDVTVTAVPEPATWALMLLGFGGLGAALRAGRRRPTPQLR